MLLYKYDEEIIKEVDTFFDISLQIILYIYNGLSKFDWNSGF